MSIPLTSIDCPHLTSQILHSLLTENSIKTTNEFLIWFGENVEISSQTNFQCIQTCIIAQTANLIERKRPKNERFFTIDRPHWTMLKTSRHLIINFQEFDENLWRNFWNDFLRRFIEKNRDVKIKYFSTNPNFSLNFDRKEVFHLDAFENELRTFRKDSTEILLIDDFFALIRPFVGLERRIRNFVLNLTRQLNRLAQENSILILTGFIFNKSDVFIDDFLADEYLFVKNLSNSNGEISFRFQSDFWVEIIDRFGDFFI